MLAQPTVFYFIKNIWISGEYFRLNSRFSAWIWTELEGKVLRMFLLPHIFTLISLKRWRCSSLVSLVFNSTCLGPANDGLFFGDRTRWTKFSPDYFGLKVLKMSQTHSGIIISIKSKPDEFCEGLKVNVHRLQSHESHFSVVYSSIFMKHWGKKRHCPHNANDHSSRNPDLSIFK